MVVVMLLVVILAAVLVPPAVRARAARRHAFVVSFGDPDGSEAPVRHRGRSRPVERRREILGSLLSAMAGTGLIGVLPTFRTLLVVHLFLVDALLAYVALLAHLGDRRAKQARPAATTAGTLVPVDDRARSGGRLQTRPRPALTSELPPVAAAG